MQDYMRRISGIKIPRSVQLVSVITDPAAWDWVLAWWQEHRALLRRHPATIELVLTAKREGLGIEPILPRPKHPTFWRKQAKG